MILACASLAVPIVNNSRHKVDRAGAFGDSYDVEQLVRSIETLDLLRPIVLKENPDLSRYEILAGNLCFEACRKLGWKSVPTLVLAGPGNKIEQKASHKTQVQPVKSLTDARHLLAGIRLSLPVPDLRCAVLRSGPAGAN